MTTTTELAKIEVLRDAELAAAFRAERAALAGLTPMPSALAFAIGVEYRAADIARGSHTTPEPDAAVEVAFWMQPGLDSICRQIAGAQNEHRVLLTTSPTITHTQPLYTRAATPQSAAREPGGEDAVFWAHFKPPFRAIELADTYYVVDSNPDCTMRIMMMWPAHAPEDTEEAERETWRLAEVFAAAANEAHKTATNAIVGKRAQDFKVYVHQRLDAMGVPHSAPESEHDKAGCRIGGRMDYVEAALARAEADAADARLAAAFRDMANRDYAHLPASLFIAHVLERYAAIDAIAQQGQS